MRALRLLAVAALVSTVAVAQPSVSVTGLAAVPQGEFDVALGAVGGGGALTLLYQVPGTPVALGAEGAVALYGYERREAPLSLTIPDVRVGVTTSNNLAQGLAVLRLVPPRGAVRPYVEGVAGLTYLFTETSVGDDRFHDDYGEPLSSTNFEDVTGVAGAGAGVLVTLHRGFTDEGRPTSVSLDARVRYLRGGRATYLARGDIDRFSDGTIRLDPRVSRTDLVVPHLGLSFTF